MLYVLKISDAVVVHHDEEEEIQYTHKCKSKERTRIGTDDLERERATKQATSFPV